MNPPRKRAAAPREPLSRERILVAAHELIATQALAGFSTRKLAERLGCEAMSIYHHFPSKQHLLDALVEQAIGEVEVPAPGPGLEARLRRCVASYRAMARRHAALFSLIALHRLNMPAGVRFIESVLRLVRAGSADDESAARRFRALGYYLIGAGLEETAGYARGPSAAEPVDDAYVVANCPTLLAAAPYFQERHWDATFELGLDGLLRGFGEAARRGS